jgi:hypothetical protein
MQQTFQAIFSRVCILRSSNRQLFNVRVYRENNAKAFTGSEVQGSKVVSSEVRPSLQGGMSYVSEATVSYFNILNSYYSHIFSIMY